MTDAMPTGPTVTYIAADRKHRPASHPVLRNHVSAESSHDAPLTGWRIHEMRVAKGMSQYDLADAIGVSRPAIAWWEMGRWRPNAEHVERLLVVLA